MVNNRKNAYAKVIYTGAFQSKCRTQLAFFPSFYLHIKLELFEPTQYFYTFHRPQFRVFKMFLFVSCL